MNNEISNSKEKVPSGFKINEKDYLNSLLACLKEMEKNYAISLTEASNEKLFNSYKKIFDEICVLQRKSFELAFKKGWYTLECAKDTKINKKYNTLLKEYEDLNM